MWLFSSHRRDAGQKLPADRLQVSQLAAHSKLLQAQSGIPFTADSCAYEPIQRLLAISTSDGRVRIIGKDGVERTLRTANGFIPEPTNQLMFLLNRGVIARLDQAGSLELWAVEPSSTMADDPSQPLHRLQLQEDSITCITPMQRDPYLLLGCSSGSIRVAALVNASGSTVTEARQVRMVQVMPYSINAKQLGAVGEVSHLTTLSNSPVHHLLAVYPQSGAVVWDLRARQLLANISTRPSRATAAARKFGSITAACWVLNSSKGSFATGHETGVVNVWALPRQEGEQQQQLQQQPQLMVTLRVSEELPCRPVRRLDYVLGKQEGLLVFGGQDEDRPDGLVLLPIPSIKQDVGIEDPETTQDAAQHATAAARKLPWFGAISSYALVAPPGALTGFEDPCAMLVLMEGGELVVHDLLAAGPASKVPQHYLPMLQAQPLVTAARLRIIPTGPVPLQGLQGACMISLRDWAAAQPDPKALGRSSTTTPVPAATQDLPGSNNSSPTRVRQPSPPSPTAATAGTATAGFSTGRTSKSPSPPGPPPGLVASFPSSAAAAAAASRWQWIADGGSVSKPDSSSSYSLLYCTGHLDGGVRLWDMYDDVPVLLGVAPSAAAVAATAGKAQAGVVSTLEFAWEQGLLISGHEGGEVRVYQFNPNPKRINCVHFESVGSAKHNEVLSIDEPPGFQLRLISLIHSSAICSSSYAPTCKLVAVSDKAGGVSLIDLAKPAVVWFQAPMQQPIVQLALGLVPLPAHKDRAEPLEGVYEEMSTGVAVRAVVAVGEDSCVAVLDAGTGFFLGREGMLRPKNFSEALYVELLDASGAPTWMARDVQDLVNLTKAGCSKAAAAAAAGPPPTNRRVVRPAAAVAEGVEAAGSTGRHKPGSPLQNGVERSWDRAGRGSALGRARSVPEGGSRSVVDSDEEEGEVDEEEEEEVVGEEEVDVDELLARAAAEVEAKDRKGPKKSKSKVPKGSSAGSSPKKVHKQRRHSASSNSSDDSSRQTQQSPRGKSQSPTRFKSSSNAANLAGMAGQAKGSGEGPAIVLDDPEAAFVLVATREFLRLYTIHHAVVADRTVAKKVPLPGPLQFATSFAIAGAPALVCIVEESGESHIQVYTLPGLELVTSTSLSMCAGWHWTWDCRQTSRLAHVIAATRHGHLALLGSGQELARLALAAKAPAPLPAAGVYDWDMAAAAHAAVTAFERMKALSMGPGATGGAIAAGGPGGVGSKAGVGGTVSGMQRIKSQGALSGAEELQEQQEQQQGELGEAGSGEQQQQQTKPKFIGFMSKIGQDFQRAGGGVAKGFQRAFDETQKGLQKVAQVFEEDLPNLLTQKVPKDGPEPAYPYPPLSAIFDCTATGFTSPSTYGGGIQQAPAATVAAAAGGGLGARGASRSPGRPSRNSTGLGAAPSTSDNVAGTAGDLAMGQKGSGGGSRWAAGADYDASREELLAGATRCSMPQASSSVGPVGGGGSIGMQGSSGRVGVASSSSSSVGSRPTGAGGGVGVRVRTADEIRQAYGRTPLNKSYEIRNVMEENRQKLAERGEKLSQIQDRSAELQETAAGFAEMAKMLAEKERAKAKWFGGS